MLYQLKLCKDRQERDERKGKKQQYTCDGCLQLFNQEDLMKHKNEKGKRNVLRQVSY